jgi:hypothetical protein
MHITALQVRIVTLPYQEAIAWQNSTETSAQYLLLKVELENGLCGFAEIPERPTWSGSTA